MNKGFPAELLGLIGCPRNDGTLDGAPGAASMQASIVDGTAYCSHCGRGYRIEGGILRLLDGWKSDPESAQEARLCDSIATDRDYDVEKLRATRADGQFEQMEMRPTLAALAPLRDRIVLELGAGTGRYTLELAKESRAVLAVDFSARSLETLATKLSDPRLPAGARVGLVQADVTLLRVAPRAFDRVLATLVSNLPTRAHRAAMYGLAARSLRANGVFAFSAHHYGLRQRVLQEPISGRCGQGGGIYRRLLAEEEILDELAGYFWRATCRPIQIALPFTYRWPGFLLEAVSRLAERWPFLGQLGFLLLAAARGPMDARALDRAPEPLPHLTLSAAARGAAAIAPTYLRVLKPASRGGPA
jgi:SAM-dependent methyltransferase